MVFVGLAAGPAAAAPTLQLGESRPLETKLGDPGVWTATETWLDMIKKSRVTLDLEHFYLSHRPGEALQPVLDEIGKAAKRGVKVRLLLDASMYKTYPRVADSLGKLPNVQFRKVDYRRLAGGVQHAKFMIADGHEVWVGSQNLDWRSLTQIHELGIRARNKVLAEAATAVFETDWRGADTTVAFDKGAYWSKARPLRIAQGVLDSADVWFGASPPSTTPTGIPWDLDLILARIAGAKRELTVQVMQYGIRNRGGADDSTLHNALLKAAARGVKVRVLVSDWALGGGNEPALRDLAAHANVEVRITRVPDWSGGYIPFARVEHCKFMTADEEWLWIGTSNWEPSYFNSTRNVGFTIRNEGLAQQAKRIFEKSWSNPTTAVWLPDTKLPARVHGMEAPAGLKVYGE
jgi:phosphatidylserine/phosphatidylglycerophosphate/cardiolipin synthase-like enzyme